MHIHEHISLGHIRTYIMRPYANEHIYLHTYMLFGMYLYTTFVNQNKPSTKDHSLNSLRLLERECYVPHSDGHYVGMHLGILVFRLDFFCARHVPFVLVRSPLTKPSVPRAGQCWRRLFQKTWCTMVNCNSCTKAKITVPLVKAMCLSIPPSRPKQWPLHKCLNRYLHVHSFILYAQRHAFHQLASYCDQSVGL